MSYDLHNRNSVKTRKDHKCEGCFETIPKGTTVAHCKGQWQGNWYDYHMCDLCLDYMNEFYEWDEGFTPGEVGEYRREHEIEQTAEALPKAINSTESLNEVEAEG